MPDQPSSTQSSGPSATQQSELGALPDLDGGKYPFELMYRLVNGAAYFNTFAMSPQDAEPAIYPENSRQVIGIRVNDTLNRFDASVVFPTLEAGVRAPNRMGELVGRIDDRWMLIPDDFIASPLRDAPPTTLDMSKPQRFAMYRSKVVFADGGDGFYGFGTGRTYPTGQGQRRLLVGAVGEVLQGFGKLAGLDGIYVLSGELSPDRGFQGNVHTRLMDPQLRLVTTSSDIPELQPEATPQLGLTYIVFGARKTKEAKTSYLLGPDGQPQGYSLQQELRIVHFAFTTQGTKGVRATAAPAQLIGHVNSRVLLNILAPGAAGTSLMPIPFTSSHEFTFTDAAGKVVGTIVAEGGEGSLFNEAFPRTPGQAGWRFGAVQTLSQGTGRFEGVEGILTHNSIASIAPHATMNLCTLCISDPEGKYDIRQ